MDWFLEKTPPGRKLLFDQATKAMLKQTKGNYPAPPRSSSAQTGRRELQESP